MIRVMHLVVCVLAVLTGSSQTRDQSSALAPAVPGHAGGSSSPRSEGPGTEFSQWTRSPAGEDETSAQTAAVTETEGTVDSVTNAIMTTSAAVITAQHTNVPEITTTSGSPSSSAAADGLSSTLALPHTAPPRHLSTEGRAPQTKDPFTAFSSQPAHTGRHAHSASTLRPQSEFLSPITTAQAATTGRPLTSALGWGPAGPAHQEVPSQLNVGDEDIKPHYHSSSTLDPLLAGLLSVFIVTTAIAFFVLLFKFRQRTNHPEFHRLQDLPMDDLMEDTPLSRYTH